MGEVIQLFDDATNARLKAAKAWLDLAKWCRSLESQCYSPGDPRAAGKVE
jgi:hypothetical protein